MEIDSFKSLPVPADLDPTAYLTGLSSTPTGWILVRASSPGSTGAAISSFLTTPDGLPQALTDQGWSGGSLGEANVGEVIIGGQSDIQFSDGLSGDWGCWTRFFVQVRSHHGLVTTPATVEFALPFLWFFDAIPYGSARQGGYRALSESGEESDLARWRVESVGGSSWLDLRVEVFAQHLRNYLRASSQVLVVQHDAHFLSDKTTGEVNLASRTDTHHFSYWASSDHISRIDHTASARLLGKHVVFPFEGGAVASTRHREVEMYPTFIVDVDEATGVAIETPSAPDARVAPYLTPVYFDRNVLQRYRSQPAKYHVSTTRLQCLHLWSLQMDVNAAGLVEVYLGDLARDLPESERQHWRAHNVVPSGGMNESRFRRDFLAQFTASDDPLSDLRRARSNADTAFLHRYGTPLILVEDPDDRLHFDRLAPPTSDGLPDFESCLLTVAKGVVDALQVSSLRTATGNQDTKVLSLALLDQLVGQLGGEAGTVDALRAIQALRSSGVAHLKGSNFDKLMQRYDLSELRPTQAFDRIVRGATATFIMLGQLLGTEGAEVSEPFGVDRALDQDDDHVPPSI